MQSLIFLNSKARKDFLERLENFYGFRGKLEGHLMMGGKEKVYLLEDSDLIRSGKDKELRIDRAGLKIATMTLGGVRFNTEGCQLLGPHCTRHVLDIDDEHLEPLVKGTDFSLSERELGQISQTGEDTGLFIIRHGHDFIGSGIIKEGKLLNQLSKIRRVKNFNH